METQMSESANTEIKVYVIDNREYNLNICAVIEGFSENAIAFGCEYLKRNNENMKFDLLIYGHWREDCHGIDLEVLIEESFGGTDDTKKNVWAVSRQILGSIVTNFKCSSTEELIFCLECGWRLRNKDMLVKHVTEYHDWTFDNDNAMQHCPDALMMHLVEGKSDEYDLSSFRRTYWFIDHHKEPAMTQSPPFSSDKIDIPRRTIGCHICNAPFPGIKELDEHFRASHTRSPTSSSKESSRQYLSRKYRCNICNYKTATKGNLHIHYQSEKHRNNQREHDQNEQKCQQQDAPSVSLLPQFALCNTLLQDSEPVCTMDTSLTSLTNVNDPTEMFECDICYNFKAKDIETILRHAELARPLPSNSEVSKMIRVGDDGSQSVELEHFCVLDGYKTRIKANFLLHFKTEKHQQKLQLLAHAREGGSDNANKMVLQMITEATSLVSIRCSLCRSTFSTAHKLRLHVDSSDHQIKRKIAVSYRVWQKALEDGNNLSKNCLITGFQCKLCGATFMHFMDILNHFQSQRNVVHMSFFKHDVDINSVVKISYINQTEKMTPSAQLKTTIVSNRNDVTDASLSVLIQCYLCNATIRERDYINHLKETHKIQKNCVDQLITLGERSHSTDSSRLHTSQVMLKISPQPNEWCDCVIVRESHSPDPLVRCQLCGMCFSTVALLEEHRAVMSHDNVQDSRGHLCFKKACNKYFVSKMKMIDHFYERHTGQISEYRQLGSFKYICKVCHLLAFSCPLKYTQHMALHYKIGDLECLLCGAVVDSRKTLRMHIESHHVTDHWPKKERTIRSQTPISPTVIPEDSHSSFSSPEAMINKENRYLQTYLQANMDQTASVKDYRSPNFMNSWSSVASLVQRVGLDNVKLVIETMINSTSEQNEKDSLVWKFAESIINVQTVQETLVEECTGCRKFFSCKMVLRKHFLLCQNASVECLNEFERIVTICREHLKKMMIMFSNEQHRKHMIPSNDTLQMFQRCRPTMTSSNQMGFYRPIFQPTPLPYRLPQMSHQFIKTLPPTTMFQASSTQFANVFRQKIPIVSEYNETLPESSLKRDNYNRKRTQIQDYQYEILRSFFDINNPPDDDTIGEITTKTGLDRKTVKHWFRNTLFKERQRSKDSPYNFTIPPETKLNIEEYENTGNVEIKSENVLESAPLINESDEMSRMKKLSQLEAKTYLIKILSQRRASDSEHEIKSPSKRARHEIDTNISQANDPGFSGQAQDSLNGSTYPISSQGLSNQNIIDQSQNSPKVDIPLDLSYQRAGNSCHRSSLTIDSVSPFESEQELAENSSSLYEERRHRTTLTAMQIQAMKSIFIHCRSPNHSELSALGDFLTLDMRVVQVWFQNQRAKSKKHERDVDIFYQEKTIFPEAVASVVDLPKSQICHCLLCNENLSAGVTKQSHLFGIRHMTMLMHRLLVKSQDMVQRVPGDNSL